MLITIEYNINKKILLDKSFLKPYYKKNYKKILTNNNIDVIHKKNKPIIIDIYIKKNYKWYQSKKIKFTSIKIVSKNWKSKVKSRNQNWQTL